MENIEKLQELFKQKIETEKELDIINEKLNVIKSSIAEIQKMMSGKLNELPDFTALVEKELDSRSPEEKIRYSQILLYSPFGISSEIKFDIRNIMSKTMTNYKLNYDNPFYNHHIKTIEDLGGKPDLSYLVEAKQLIETTNGDVQQELDELSNKYIMDYMGYSETTAWN